MNSQSAIKIAFSVAALCGASAAFAQQPWYGNVRQPWYVEGSVGWSKMDPKSSGPTEVFGRQGVTSSTSFDEKDNAWSLTLGYRFHPNWGIEGSYTNLGKYSYSGAVLAPRVGAVSGEYKANAWGLAAVGNLPLDKGFSLYGRLGLTYNEAKLDASSTGSPVSGGKTHDTGWLAGLGAKYDFTPQVYARFGWDRYFRVGDNDTTGRSDIDVIGAGVGFRF